MGCGGVPRARYRKPWKDSQNDRDRDGQCEQRCRAAGIGRCCPGRREVTRHSASSGATNRGDPGGLDRRPTPTTTPRRTPTPRVPASPHSRARSALQARHPPTSAPARANRSTTYGTTPMVDPTRTGTCKPAAPPVTAGRVPATARPAPTTAPASCGRRNATPASCRDQDTPPRSAKNRNNIQHSKRVRAVAAQWMRQCSARKSDCATTDTL